MTSPYSWNSATATRKSATKNGSSGSAAHGGDRIETKAKIEAERRERERLKKMEQDRVERLLADADQFRRAETLRGYVEAADLHFSREPRQRFERWRVRALALADQLDPLRNGSFLRSMEEVDYPDTSHEDK